MIYLHSKKILHCDLKSSNLIFDKKFNIKIADFGLSQIFQEKKSKKSKNLRKGTPHWMAPEVMRG